jgi:hypothetical protein
LQLLLLHSLSKLSVTGLLLCSRLLQFSKLCQDFLNLRIRLLDLLINVRNGLGYRLKGTLVLS